MRKRTSKIWTVPQKDLQDLLNSSNSLVEVISKIGLDPYNGNHKTLNQRIKEEQLDLSILKNNRKKFLDSHIKRITTSSNLFS